MRFPNAHKGVKLIFLAEIIALIASLVALVAAIIVSASTSGNAGLDATAATLTLVSGIASIVVFVIELIGLFNGARESKEFSIALWLVLVGVLITIVNAILQSLPATKGLSPILFAVLTTVATVCDFFVVLCVLFGIASLAEQLGNGEMAEKGRRLAFYIIFVYAISLLFGLMPGFSIYVNPGIRLLFSIFGIAAAVLEIVVYVSTLIYLHHSAQMLEE